VDAGSREENASKQESRASVLIQSEPEFWATVHNLCDAEDYGATMVAVAPRLLLARNTQLTFGFGGVPLLRAPLFSHTPR
jgi:hypothetical protein